MRLPRLWIGFFLFGALGLPAAGQATHPLDPLTFREHWTFLEALQEADRLDQKTRFSEITLLEPTKAEVLAWSENDPIPRRATGIVRQEKDAFRAVVDLAARRVDTWQKLEGVHPNWLGSEFGSMTAEIWKHPDFLEAMKRRGITDPTFVDCSGGPPGYFGTDEEIGRRIAHYRCHDARGVRNFWTRGIEGLTAVVDLEERTVIRVVDEGPVPVPRTIADFDRDSIGPPREVPGLIRMSQPLGPGFEIDGHRIHWQNWSFHVRPDQRTGMVLSLVRYREGDRDRSVLYQGHLSEIFVPYMDPSFAWYARNFLDAGEYNAGGLTKPLMAGMDCPENAVYVDALIAGDNGRPRTVPNMICIFERYAGDVAWRHHSRTNPESRPARDLVVRSAAVLGNYDYLFDWTFQQNGSIQVGVGSTGIPETKMVPHATASEATSDGEADVAEAPDAYGRFVDRNVVAVNHDHYFSFRIDLDVDGPANRFVVDRLVSKTLPAEHPRRSLWVRSPKTPRTELEARLNIDLTRPALWRVQSTTRQNHVGYPTSYQLMPGRTASTLLSEDDYPRRRAGFINHHLWVTPYRHEERYAAGDYPTLSTPGQGLPEWTRADRTIADTDVVLWYTVGMHHLVRAEDWPVMPVMYQTFEIRPFDFFDRNPALDLPRTP